jgi:alkaline phosphatase D
VLRELIANRRQFVLAGASLAILPWLGGIAQGATRRRAAFDKNPFSLGVASGDPSPDGMVLWTRLAPEPIDGGGMPPETFEVRWELATDDAFQQIVRSGKTLATPQLGHSVHLELAGLEPNRPYWYRFHCGDATSVVGRTRTTPAADAMPDRLRFAFASCQHFEHGLFTAYEHMSREDLDLVIHLGDYIYEYAGKDNLVRKHTGGEIVTLEDYRNRYALYRTDEHLQATHAAFPWLLVWDDHETDNNYASDISEELNVSPETLLLRRANAYQAYYEMMPLRAAAMPTGPDMTLYRTVPFGRLAQFEMLDTRQYRSDQPNNDRRSPINDAVLDPRNTLLGAKQEKWLMRELLKSTSQWNVLAQQVMFGPADREPGEAKLYSMDQWSCAPVARARLLEFMATRKVPNPVVLTGDIHTNWVNDLHVDFDRDGDPVVGTEFVCTSISSGGNGVDKPKHLDALYAENPFIRFHNAERGYVQCEVTPDAWRSDFQVVTDVLKPGGQLQTRASFVVENGQPGAKPA